MLCRRVALTSLAAALLFASAAAATLPPVGPIIPGKSIDGLHLGITFAAAKNMWGTSGQCGVTNAIPYCGYPGSGALSGRASFSATRGKVSSIGIEAAYAPTKRQFVVTGPLAQFHTSKGIHIGSSAAAVSRAYPKTTTAAGGMEIELRTGKHAITFFLVAHGTVYGITMNA